MEAPGKSVKYLQPEGSDAAACFDNQVLLYAKDLRYVSKLFKTAVKEDLRMTLILFQRLYILRAT